MNTPSYYIPDTNPDQYPNQYYNNKCVSRQTIDRMISQGAPQAQIDHAQRTMNSLDANDVAHHRNYINNYNPGDQWRHVNNLVMHTESYRYGHSGPSSVEGIARQLGSNGQQITSAVPFNVPPQLQPYFKFQ